MSDQPIDPARLKSLRDQVIRYVYANGASNYGWGVKMDKVQEALGITRRELQTVYMLMMEQGLSAEQGMIADIGLSKNGQEEALRLGAETPMHEPRQGPITINANYSIVQVAGDNSSQSGQVSIDQSEVTQIIDQIEKEIPSLNLTDGERAEAKDLLTSLRELIMKQLPGAAMRAVGAALSAIITAGGSKLGELLMKLLHIKSQ